MEGQDVCLRYSAPFKQKVISEIESGKYSVSEAHRVYEVSTKSLYSWLRQFGKNHLINKTVRVEMKNEDDRIKRLEKEKQELESALAQAHLKIIALESTITVAGDLYNEDLKKKFAMPVSKEVSKK